MTYWHRWTFWAPAFLSGHDVSCMSDYLLLNSLLGILNLPHISSNSNILTQSNHYYGTLPNQTKRYRTDSCTSWGFLVMTSLVWRTAHTSSSGIYIHWKEAVLWRGGGKTVHRTVHSFIYVYFYLYATTWQYISRLYVYTNTVPIHYTVQYKFTVVYNGKYVYSLHLSRHQGGGVRTLEKTTP